MTLLGAVLLVASWRGWLPYGLTETLGFVTGAACVYLTLKLDILNFPLGIANNIFFLVLFIETRLYGDASLQIVYLILGLHGWYSWLRGGPERTPLTVRQIAPRHWLTLIGFVLLGTLALTLTLRAVNGSAPVLDALTTTLSLAAQFLLNYKFIENWYVWLAADLIYIYLFMTRGLTLTAVLYFIFVGLCIGGLLNWWRALGRNEPAGAALDGEGTGD